MATPTKGAIDISPQRTRLRTQQGINGFVQQHSGVNQGQIAHVHQNEKSLNTSGMSPCMACASCAAALFDTVVIAVARAVHKKTLFGLDERLQLAQAALADCSNVKALPFDGLIVDFVKAQGASVIVRGLRSVTDYDYETQMAGMNRHLAPQVDTVFLHTSANVQHISSTLVREIHKLGGDVSGLVSKPVLAGLKALNSGA